MRRFLEFIAQIREFRGAKLSIDLTRLKRLEAPATLMFKAELCYLRQRGVTLSAIPTERGRVRQVLHQTGLAALLRMNITITIDRDDVVHWRHASGPHGPVDSARVGDLLTEANDRVNYELYSGTIESVSNCVEHAYKAHPARRRVYTDEDGWWAFQQVRDGAITVCVCDLGIGVPNALPITLADKPGLIETLIWPFRKLRSTDCRSIRAAFEYGRTSTGKSNRGKGLRDATNVIDAANSGFFILFSNRGMYVYSRATGRTQEYTVRLPRSIHGTIYMWHYPLQSGDDSPLPESP